MFEQLSETILAIVWSLSSNKKPILENALGKKAYEMFFTIAKFNLKNMTKIVILRLLVIRQPLACLNRLRMGLLLSMRIVIYS